MAVPLNAEFIINELAQMIAQLHVDLAIARSQIPVIGNEPDENGATVLEVIDGGKKEEKDEDDE